MALLGRPTSRWTGARFLPSMLSHYFVFATWIVIWISMGMAVDADCDFRRKNIYIPSFKRLELECVCQQASNGYPVIHFIDIQMERDGKNITLDDKERVPNSDIRIQTKIDDQSESKENAKTQYLWLTNYAGDRRDDVFYCVVLKRNNKEHDSKRISHALRMSDILPTTTTTTTTTSTTTAATSTESRPSPTPPIETDITEIAATVVNNKDGFSGVSLYVVVAISCVLLIVIVLVIICYVRVRRKRQRQRAETEDLDLAESGTLPRMNSTPRSASPRRTRPELQLTQADVQGIGESTVVDSDRREDRPEAVPLLPHSHTPTGRPQYDRRRRSATSEDEATSSRRKNRLDDVPRRKRIRHGDFGTYSSRRRARADASRSFDLLDSVEYGAHPPYGYPRSYRYSFPRAGHYVDYYSEGYDDEDEDYDGVVYYDDDYYHRGRAGWHMPQRSLSQHSLRRQRHSPRQVQATFMADPRQPLAPFRPPPQEQLRHVSSGSVAAQRSNMYHERDEPQLEPESAINNRQIVPGNATTTTGRSDTVPLTVRVNEDNNVAYHYQGQQSSYSEQGDGSPYEDTEYQPFDVGQLHSPAMAQGAPLVSNVPQTRPLAAAVAPMHVASEDPALMPHGPVYGEVLLDRRLQQARNTRVMPTHSLPMPGRRRHFSSASSARQHYHTTSMPRRKGKRARSVGHSGIPDHLADAQFIHMSNGEGRNGYAFPQVEAGELQAMDELQSQRRRPPGWRGASRSAGDVRKMLSVVSPSPVVGHGAYPLEPSTREMTSTILQDGELFQYPPTDAGGSEVPRGMNVLSRENLSQATPRAVTSNPLNVPLAGAHASAAHSRRTPFPSTTRRETEAGGKQSRAKARQRAQHLCGPSNNTVIATDSDASTNATFPKHHCQHSTSISSSDSDNDSRNHNPPSSRRPPTARATPTRTEIDIRDIKTDNETRRKRPVSFKANNARPPVACAADDVALSTPRPLHNQQSGATPSDHHSPRQPRLQKKESCTSRDSARGGGSSHGYPASGDMHDATAGSELLREQFGVEVTGHSLSSQQQVSAFTEHNHSTAAKMPHLPTE